MDRRKQRGRLLSRDKRRCGVHLGGCGKIIEQRQKCNVDHIIPSAFFSKTAGGNRSRYERDWNCQPMHVSCNQEKAAEVTEWPKFRCRCHFLQVEQGHLFVRTRGQAGAERHTQCDIGQRGQGRRPVGGRAWKAERTKGTGGCGRDEGGIRLYVARDSEIECPGHEKARVGLRIPRRFELTDDGRVVPVGTELVKGSLRKGDYSHFPSLRVPEGGIAIFGPRR